MRTRRFAFTILTVLSIALLIAVDRAWRSTDSNREPIAPTTSETMNLPTPEAPSPLEALVERAPAVERVAQENELAGAGSAPPVADEPTRPVVSDLVIRVRDESTGLDLPDVTLVAITDWESVDTWYPDLAAAERVLASHARSPVPVPFTRSGPGSGSGNRAWTCFGWAPGYTWNRIRVDASSVGEHQMFLRPGGDLELRIERDASEEELRLRVRSTSTAQGAGLWPPAVDLAIEVGDTLRIDGLAPGPYRVTAELGEWWHAPSARGSVDVEIVAGGLAHATLVITTPAPLERVPFSGVVFLPPEWTQNPGAENALPPASGDRLFVLEIEPVRGGTDSGSLRRIPFAEMTGSSSGSRDSYFHFDAGLIAPATYEVRVEPLYYSVTHEVGPAGDTAFRLDVPPPATVSVRVLEKDSDEPAGIDRIFWACKRPSLVDGGGLENVIRHPTTGCFEFKAPESEIELRFLHDDYALRIEYVRLNPGRNELTVRLERSCGVTISLQCAGRRIPCSPDSGIAVEPVDGDGQMTSVRSDSNGNAFRYSLSAPGRYRVTIPPIEGYEPVPPQEIEIPATKFIDLPIELVPRH